MASQDNESFDVEVEISDLNEPQDKQSHNNPWPFLGDFFTFKSREGDKLIFSCKLCLPKDVQIKAHLSSRNNLKQHIIRTHSSKYPKFEETCNAVIVRGKAKQRFSSGSSNESIFSPPDAKKTRQLTIDQSFACLAKGSGVPQSAVDDGIVDLFVENMLPFHVVESSTFKRLIQLLNPSKKSISRRTLGRRIVNSHCDLMQYLIRHSAFIKNSKMADIKEVSSNKCFSGYQKVYSHESSELKCQMKFGSFIPSQAESEKVPVIFWLSGLTCTEQNFITKAGSQQYAAKHGFIVISPDTSPRGVNIEGEDDSYDFGSGAGFYVDATEEKWKAHYRMYSYITKELLSIVAANFNADIGRMGIMGHSMGGHGALICSLKNPGLFKSVSAFAPICNPTQCPWGIKALTGYLGETNKDAWKDYDACELVKNYSGPSLEILVDQGAADNFLTDGQLLPDNLIASCAKSGVAIIMRKQEDYDHSYYFIASFLGEHFDHHAKYLLN